MVAKCVQRKMWMYMSVIATSIGQRGQYVIGVCIVTAISSLSAGETVVALSNIWATALTTPESIGTMEHT